LERLEGLSKLLMPDLWEHAEYFARVLLAPDPLVISYRARGGPVSDLASTFLIPERVARARWKDPLQTPAASPEAGKATAFSVS
jgi:hypothetical protein